MQLHMEIFKRADVIVTPTTGYLTVCTSRLFLTRWLFDNNVEMVTSYIVFI